MKFNIVDYITGIMASLPAGERGLKYRKEAGDVPKITSLPAGERGLKYLWRLSVTSGRYVAPRRGAWIEIHDSKHVT